MDYYNSMLPQNQQPPMMQSAAAAMHYSQMAQPEIGQDLWDHEKHVSLPLVHQMPTNNRTKPNFSFFNCFHRIKGGRNGLTSQLAS